MKHVTAILPLNTLSASGLYKIPEKALRDKECCIVIAAGKKSRQKPKKKGKTIVNFWNEQGNLTTSIMLVVCTLPPTLSTEAIEVHGWENDGKKVRPISFENIGLSSLESLDTKESLAGWLRRYHHPQMPVYIAKP